MPTSLRHLDLFSGIGGFALAARWAGIDTIGFSEIDPYCCKLLKKNFPGIPNYGDITKLDGRTITADLITGGVPCQPFSLAGKQQGQNDERHLWPEMLRVIEESKPTWVLVENVVGFISLALERVCTDLESLGFEVQPLVIPACAVNAPHRRDRVWILTYSASNAGKLQQSQRQNIRDESAINGTAGVVADRQSNRVGKSQRQNWEQNGRSSEPSRVDALRSGGVAADPDSERSRTGSRLSNEQRERLSDTDGSSWGGAPERREDGDDFRLTEPPLCGANDGVSSRVDRLRGLGNAIVPQVAYQILKGMVPWPSTAD